MAHAALGAARRERRSAASKAGGAIEGARGWGKEEREGTAPGAGAAAMAAGGDGGGAAAAAAEADAEAPAALEASDCVVIAPGSRTLRVGFAATAEGGRAPAPAPVAHCVAYARTGGDQGAKR